MTYPGGKGLAGVTQWIINQMPPHSLYVEAFVGGGAVLRAKRPALATIAIDADSDVTIALSGEGLPGVSVVCGDAISWLESATPPRDALVYCDPPYVAAARRSTRALYRHELTDDDHRRLLRCLRGLGCYVMVSGYWSELYAGELKGWRVITRRVMTRGGTEADERLWMNYPTPAALHDYRFLGDTFRERERIKRKRLRWRARLLSLPASERYAILSVLADLGAPIAGSDPPLPPPNTANGDGRPGDIAPIGDARPGDTAAGDDDGRGSVVFFGAPQRPGRPPPADVWIGPTGRVWRME